MKWKLPVNGAYLVYHNGVEYTPLVDNEGKFKAVMYGYDGTQFVPIQVGQGGKLSAEIASTVDVNVLNQEINVNVVNQELQSRIINDVINTHLVNDIVNVKPKSFVRLERVFSNITVRDGQEIVGAEINTENDIAVVEIHVNKSSQTNLQLDVFKRLPNGQWATTRLSPINVNPYKAEILLLRGETLGIKAYIDGTQTTTVTVEQIIVLTRPYE